MSSLINSSFNAHKEIYIEELKVLSKSKWGRGLIVDKQGNFLDVSFVCLVWEKIKGFFGWTDLSDKRIIAFQAVRFLSQGVELGVDQLTLLTSLADRAGILPRIARQPEAIRDTTQLVNYISLYLFKGERDVPVDLMGISKRFYVRYREVLKPLYPEFEKKFREGAQAEPLKSSFSDDLKQEFDLEENEIHITSISHEEESPSELTELVIEQIPSSIS